MSEPQVPYLTARDAGDEDRPGPLPLGPMLEELVARQVLGWDEERVEMMRQDWTASYGDYHFSRSWEGAGMVVERMRALGWSVEISDERSVWYVIFLRPSGAPGTGEGTAPTFPHAVALASLAALGGNDA